MGSPVPSARITARIGRRVAADRRCTEGGPVGQGDCEIGRLVHHVAVGQDISVRREDHCRTSSDNACSRTGPSGAGGDAHDRRADVLHDRDDRSRVGVQEFTVVDAAGRESVHHCSHLWSGRRIENDKRPFPITVGMRGARWPIHSPWRARPSVLG